MTTLDYINRLLFVYIAPNKYVNDLYVINYTGEILNIFPQIFNIPFSLHYYNPSNNVTNKGIIRKEENDKASQRNNT